MVCIIVGIGVRLKMIVNCCFNFNFNFFVMKELVKPQKVEKEYNDAQVYCEGGNNGMESCTGHVTGYIQVCSSMGIGCRDWSTVENNDSELLF